MDQVTNAIAVVGVYFALMAVLSVSVEAVIGWFKIPIHWLQGKPSAEEILNEVKSWLPADQHAETQEARYRALNKFLKAIGETPIDLDQDISLADVVGKIGAATTAHIEQERVRRGVIRLLAVVLGVVFAVVFQIDTLQLLAPISDSAQGLWMDNLGSEGAHIVGLVLSGLAASAGSSFWHDQSARLRNLKKATASIAELTGS